VRGVAVSFTVLRAQMLLDRDGVRVIDVVCRQEAARGDTQEAGHHAVVFVRQGCFIRQAGGAPQVLDATNIYCINPGDEQRYDHSHPHGDDCTSVRLDPSLLASLWGGDPTLPALPLPSAPPVDLQHRLLLTDIRRAGEPDALVERTISLVAAALAASDARRVASGQPSTIRARTALVDVARQCLVADPSVSLPELAAGLDVSPHHLSRTFRAVTGHTISRHRMRLRARAALERIAQGDHDLTRLAVDLGFADQSHLCRVLRAETTRTPSALRHALAHSPDQPSAWPPSAGRRGRR
jgi:AraC-like DNA-binding protein